MPDGRPALTGAERKRRYDRRAGDGSIYFRGDLPLDICELLMDYGYKADDDSTGRGVETLPTRLRSWSNRTFGRPLFIQLRT